MGVIDRIRRRTQTASLVHTYAGDPLSEFNQRRFHELLIQASNKPWQELARVYNRKLGLLRFANGLIADLASRAEPIVEECYDLAGDQWRPATDSRLPVAMRAYRGDQATLRDLVRSHVWYQQTIGEMVQVVRPSRTRGGLSWSVRDPQSVMFAADQYYLAGLPGAPRASSGYGMDINLLFEPVRQDQLQRLWTPDETWELLAQSPTQAVLDDCVRYWLLGRSIDRTSRSRMIQAGWFWTPLEAHSRMDRRADGGKGGQGVSTFEKDYYEIAKLALDETNDGAVAAAAPFHITWSKEFGEPKTGEFGRGHDPEMIDHRREVREDIARGINLPREVILGEMGSANHWSGWMLTEDVARSTLSPILDRVYRDITDTAFRPMLRTVGWPGDLSRVRVSYDLSSVTIKPDRSGKAVELYRLGLLDKLRVIETCGFEGTDLPTGVELEEIVATLTAISKGGDASGGSPAGTGQSPAQTASANKSRLPWELPE